MSIFCLENRIFLKIAWKKLKFFENLPEKIKILNKFARKSRNFSWNCWKNQNFSEICLEKFKFCWPGSTTPQISNQIDAAECWSSSFVVFVEGLRGRQEGTSSVAPGRILCHQMWKTGQVGGSNVLPLWWPWFDLCWYFTCNLSIFCFFQGIDRSNHKKVFDQ